MALTEGVERLRPAAMQSRPVRLEGIFDDPEAVVRLIQERSPYITISERGRPLP